ncbi:MAG TPA: class I tRNA ligase family protein, partial [Patescibacteria group bacterium]|nr:class I tRNA ligase family protein [Patescibacteria group bacterium]
MKTPNNINLNTEEDVLKFWDENKIFEKSIQNRAKGKEYSFYDGPPFATGKPHHGHILATTIKDTVARFWTMKGYKVERRVGWDCHGLPVENLIEKEIGIRSKKDIEAMGIEKFNEACRQAVFRSVGDFEKTLERVGRWADYSNAYATLDLPYMESVWWVFKQIHDQGLAYQDFRVTPYCPRCGTPLSNFEVNLNYKDDTIDPSVYIKFPIKKDARYEMQDLSFLVWTTTPWTLHGNVALAINPKSVYARVKHNEEKLILAKAQLAALGGAVEIIEEMIGEKLIGLSYEPLYPAKDAENGGYKVMAGDFVSMEDGTGIVHIAPAFGVDDYQMHKQHNLPIINNISLEGRFFDITQTWNGKKAKDADKDIIEDLRTRGLLFKAETIKHTYPFCWRCEHYLIYYAIESWYIGVTKVKDQLIKNNKKIHWMPRHLKDGRFGKWLNGARDWAVSRTRFWGAPLPVWECENNHREVFGNISDLTKKIPGNTTFTFIRHGESEHNAKDVCNGDPTKEFHLTPKGRRQVEKSAKELAKQKFDVIFCSDFIRAHETAEILKKHIKAEVKEDKRLGDINVGQCEGLPRTQCRLDQSKAPVLYEYRFPGGESLADIEKRMTAALADIEKQYPSKNVLVVSHEDPIKTVYAAYGLVRDHDVHSLHIGN